MIEQLKKFKERYDFLTEQSCDPNVISDIENYTKICKEQRNLQEYAELYDKYISTKTSLDKAMDLAKNETDSELKALADDEVLELKSVLDELNKQIKIALLPKDAKDDSDTVILEVRGGAGGDEASLFASELLKMYQRYAEKQGWRVEVVEYNETEVGGIREGVIVITGQGSYKRLKFESGVHRVQRVPETESQGRVHTSTVTVAVLAEVENVDIEILDKDLRIDTFHSGGCGGQGVNTTDSAIRITHIPSGIVVTCQDERSQIKNKDKAMKILRAKLQDLAEEKAIAEHAQERRTQVGTGNRNERIRTYNFPQGRVTDHRISFSLYNINEFMQGDIDEMLDALHTADQQLKLEKANEQQ